MATTITPEPSPNANSKIYAVSGRRVLPASITAGMVRVRLRFKVPSLVLCSQV